MWLEEEEYVDQIKEWWENINVKGWAGYKLVLKLKRLKERIKEWTKNHFGDVSCTKANILEKIQSLDIREGLHIWLDEESSNRDLLKDFFFFE